MARLTSQLLKVRPASWSIISKLYPPENRWIIDQLAGQRSKNTKKIKGKLAHMLQVDHRPDIRVVRMRLVLVDHISAVRVDRMPVVLVHMLVVHMLVVHMVVHIHMLVVHMLIVVDCMFVRVVVHMLVEKPLHRVQLHEGAAPLHRVHSDSVGLVHMTLHLERAPRGSVVPSHRSQAAVPSHPSPGPTPK